MNERLKAILSQLAAFWGGLSLWRRVALVGGTLGVLGATLLLTGVGQVPRHAYLYTDLSLEDAASISRKLDELKVPYEAGPEPGAIRVPEERVHRLRLQLASEGLPRGGGVGFEIFDRSRLGATEFEQRVNLRRALEGELSRTVGSVQGVRSARVHLVVPERRIFAAAREEASASVVVRPIAGRTLGKTEVAAIVHLVVSAVPGLSRDRVSVVSTDGVTLHSPRDDAADPSGAGAREGGPREEALALERQVTSLLERAVGPGNAAVRVAFDLDSATRERTEEHYEPTRTAVRSEQQTEELSGAAAAAGVAGVPGALSNLPDGVPPDEIGAEPAGSLVRRTHVRNWEVDKVTEKTQTPAGKLRRVSVAVLVNGAYELQGAERVWIDRKPEELARLTELVKHAVGFDAQRGDSVELSSARFVEGDPEPPAPAAPPWQRYTPWAGAALAALVALVAAIALVVRRRKRKTTALAPAPAGIDQSPGVAAPRPTITEVFETPPPSPALRERALLLASQDPGAAAAVLRGWLDAPPAVNGPART
ncbi:MAG: flagellar M-ring protein FliF [Polyangiaceae bacterium]|nr:flagellar M-ring protein FliF [Polyangiaceae bacterium]